MFSAWDIGSWIGSLGAVLLLFCVLTVCSLILAYVAMWLGEAGNPPAWTAGDGRREFRRAA